MEYEIYKEYLNCKKTGDQFQKDHFTLRNKIHCNEDIKSILISGKNRASLLGVQLLIVFRTKNDGRYQALTIKRSDTVAARPGFYQFVPSGGFEVFENSDEHNRDELKENYNILWAIYREYLEELIIGNKTDYEYGQGGETIAKIEREPEIKRISGYLNEKKAYFEFLGSAVELCGLRNELSFVLRIDTTEYSEMIFNSNNESIKINRYYIDEIEKHIDTNKLNPSSAALWYMFTQNHLYKEII